MSTACHGDWYILIGYIRAEELIKMGYIIEQNLIDKLELTSFNMVDIIVVAKS